MIPYLLQCYFSIELSRLPVSHCLIACYSRSTSITVILYFFHIFHFLSEAPISLSWILNSSYFNSYNTGLAPSFHSLPRNIQILFNRCRDFRREEQSESSILFAFNSIITNKIVCTNPSFSTSMRLNPYLGNTRILSRSNEVFTWMITTRSPLKFPTASAEQTHSAA